MGKKSIQLFENLLFVSLTFFLWINRSKLQLLSIGEPPKSGTEPILNKWCQYVIAQSYRYEKPLLKFILLRFHDVKLKVRQLVFTSIWFVRLSIYVLSLKIFAKEENNDPSYVRQQK